MAQTSTSFLRRSAPLLLALGALLLSPACATPSGGGQGGRRGATEASAPSPQVLEVARLVDARTEDLSPLVALSTHPDAAVRAEVARGLGRLQDPDAIPILATLTQDPSPAVRREALFALGQIDRDEATRLLMSRYDTETELPLKAVAVDSLGRTGDASAESILVEALGAGDPTLAAVAATAAGIQAYRKHWEEGYSLALSEALNQALKVGTPAVRQAAAYAYSRGAPAEAARDRARQLVGEALKDGDPALRQIAALALARIGDPSDGLTLAPLLADDVWEVRVNALRGMAKLGGPTASWLIRPGIDDPAPLVQEAAIVALGSAGDPTAADWLLPLIESPSIALSTSALAAVATLKGKDALPLLEEAGGKDSPWLRAQAAASLGEVGSAEAARILIARSKYELDPRVMVQVASALGEAAQKGITSPDPIAPLEALLLRADPATATVVATTFGELGRTDLLPTLLEAYARQRPGKDFEAQVAIIEALETIGGPEALLRATLDGALEDPNPHVNQAAAKALKALYKVEADPIFLTGPLFPLSASAYAQVLQTRRAWIETSQGTIVVDLFPDLAPVTVSNFERLAKQGFYDGILWHRVVPNFVAQAGSPRGDGWGGPGYTIRCEVAPAAYTPGTLGMALSGKDTGGSQFFITHTSTPHLEGTYTIFGRVAEGMDVLDSLVRGDTIRTVRFTPRSEEPENIAADAISPF